MSLVVPVCIGSRGTEFSQFLNSLGADFHFIALRSVIAVFNSQVQASSTSLPPETHSFHMTILFCLKLMHEMAHGHAFNSQRSYPFAHK